MNTSSKPRRCPACSAEIPAEAPQGLCPKCLLMGVASVAEPPIEAGGSVAAGSSAQRDRARVAANDNRPAPPSIDELAAAFPQLEILELIGRGGMGFVYKARQPKLDRLVALKILPGHLASEPSFHERFEREARVLAKLQHPLIVSVYDFGEAVVRERLGIGQSVALGQMGSMGCMGPGEVDSNPILPISPIESPNTRSYFYLTLEYVDGVNLREAMRAGRFTPEQALAIVPQVCEALQYAHSKGVLHRDIKPENILLDTDGRVKIADFGIAKVLGPEMDASSSLFASGGASESEMAVTRLTATGSVLGTPLYMAPEQLISPNAVDHRADIFSLGVVFYEMLTGELPMGRFAPPSEKSLANQLIDQRIDEVVLRALAKERELRQQSANELKTEVETITSHPRRATIPPPIPTAAGSSRQTPGATGGSFGPSVGLKNTGERSPSPVAPGVSAVSGAAMIGNTSGSGGWWALFALFIGTPLAMSPMITFTAVRVDSANVPPQPSVSWTIFAIAIMLLFTVGGAFTPLWLGWRHLLHQHRDHSRNGIIPALIAAYFLPLLVLDLVLFYFIFWPLVRYPTAQLIALYVAPLLCAIVDGVILYSTWCWAARTSFSRERHASAGAQTDSDQTPRQLWGLGLLVASILLAVGWGMYVANENRRIATQWMQEITSAQHEWQEANGALNVLETRWKSRAFDDEAPEGEAGRAAASAKNAAEFKVFTEESARLREWIAELNGQMKVLSGMGNYRDGLTSFLPVALFAIPLGVTGLILLLRRRRVIWTIGAVAGSLVVVFIAIQILAERWNVSLAPTTTVALSGHNVPTDEPTFDRNVVGNREAEPFRTSDQPANQKVSAAAAEAKRLGLIRVADATSGVHVVQQPIRLKGDAGEVLVEPHFSALVRLPAPTNRLTFVYGGTADSRGTTSLVAEYPCDYIACDWISGTDLPRILGYILPPGAYDFRADAETNRRLTAASRVSLAEVASRALQLVATAALKSAATEFDWQQATQAAHLRFKFVPKSISKLDVPDECLVVLTGDSRTLFTRDGGRFTKLEHTSAQPIDRLRGQISLAAKEAAANALLATAHAAASQHKWEDLLRCMTDDCRDDWIFEITTSRQRDFESLMGKAADKELKEKDQTAMTALARMSEALYRSKRESIPDSETMQLKQRFTTYSTLTAAERRQYRVDVMRTWYSDLAEVATTALTHAQELDEAHLIIDLSTVKDLHVEDEQATGTWITADGTGAPLVLRRVDLNGERVWKIDSLVGKSVLDGSNPVPATPVRAIPAPADADAPADASVPQNAPGDGLKAD